MKKPCAPFIPAFLIVLAALALPLSGQKFTADWTSLEQYKCPEWFRDAKLGIFLHWGPSDPDALVSVFKKAGAKFVVPVAVHHDNFDLWDSKYQRWNAVNMGPKKDIIALWRKAVLAQGLRFGVSTHMDRTLSWFNTSRGADKTGPLAGVPYDGANPEYADLYGPPNGEGMDWPLGAQ